MPPTHHDRGRDPDDGRMGSAAPGLGRIGEVGRRASGLPRCPPTAGVAAVVAAAAAAVAAADAVAVVSLAARTSTTGTVTAKVDPTPTVEDTCIDGVKGALIRITHFYLLHRCVPCMPWLLRGGEHIDFWCVSLYTFPISADSSMQYTRELDCVHLFSATGLRSLRLGRSRASAVSSRFDLPPYRRVCVCRNSESFTLMCPPSDVAMC